MDSYKPFTVYANISRYMLSRGYTCDSQNDLLKIVEREGDNDTFMHTLFETRLCIIDDHRAESNGRKSSFLPPLTSYERMTAKWKKLSKGIDSQILVYYHTPVMDGMGGIKKVAKNDTVTALKYLTLSGCKCLLFVHGPDLIAAALKQLTDPIVTPSKINYRFEIKCASLFDVKVDEHMYVPKHEIVTNPTKFLTEEGLEKGKMPKISFEDPAIRNLGAKIGDIVRIHRTMDFSDVSTLFYREVTSSQMEVHKPRKTARTR